VAGKEAAARGAMDEWLSYLHDSKATCSQKDDMFVGRSDGVITFVVIGHSHYPRMEIAFHTDSMMPIQTQEQVGFPRHRQQRI
jgi:hypothetical protein